MLRALLTCFTIVFALAGSGGTAVAQDQPAAAREAKAPAVVNINIATTAQIATLPGIGSATAQRIVEYREKNGAFKKIEELMNVRGIGEKSFLKIRPFVTVGDNKAAAK